jgi:hypothetical protein
MIDYTQYSLDELEYAREEVIYDIYLNNNHDRCQSTGYRLSEILAEIEFLIEEY